MITYALHSSEVLLVGKETVFSGIEQGFTAEGTNVTRTGGHPIASMAFVIYNIPGTRCEI
jgi:hypothetical protein